MALLEAHGAGLRAGRGGGARQGAWREGAPSSRRLGPGLPGAGAGRGGGVKRNRRAPRRSPRVAARRGGPFFCGGWVRRGGPGGEGARERKREGGGRGGGGRGARADRAAAGDTIVDESQRTSANQPCPLSGGADYARGAAGMKSNALKSPGVRYRASFCSSEGVAAACSRLAVAERKGRGRGAGHESPRKRKSESARAGIGPTRRARAHASSGLQR